jgi:hypothetical protein
MEKTIEYYSRLGIGPFEPFNVTPKERQTYGKPSDDIKNLVRLGYIGDVQIELFQPVAGESVHMEFFRDKGEGIHHIAKFVDDLENEVAQLVEKGFEIIASGKFEEGGGFAYFDTRKFGGVIFELVQWPPGWQPN